MHLYTLSHPGRRGCASTRPPAGLCNPFGVIARNPLAGRGCASTRPPAGLCNPFGVIARNPLAGRGCASTRPPAELCNPFGVIARVTAVVFTPKGLHSSAGGRVLAHPRRLAAVLTATLLITLCLSPRCIAAEERKASPNILLLIADDMGWRDVGYHDSDIRTPHLDKLAKTGVRLERHYVYPTCSPTRGGLLTGRNASRFGIQGPIADRSELSLPADTRTLATVLKSRGYATALFGKWHLGLRPEVGPRSTASIRPTATCTARSTSTRTSTRTAIAPGTATTSSSTRKATPPT